MKIKIITLNFNNETGGGSHLTLEILLKYLSEKSHDVTLIASNIILNKEKIPYKIIEEKIQGKFIDTVKQVKNIIKKYESDTDLFLLYGASLIFAGSVYKKEKGGVPIAVYINSYIPALGLTKPNLQDLNLYEKIFTYIKHTSHRWKHYFWDKIIGLKIVSLIDLIIFDSPSILKIYTDFGFPKEKSVVCPELIDTEKIQKISSTLSDKKINKKNITSFLYVGRLIYDKGVDILLEATSLIESRDKLLINIVGRGQQKKYLEKKIFKNKLEKYVKIYPWQNQEDLISFYKNTDVFVHPGRWPEPFGRTIVEVMSLGKPVITSDIGGTVFAMGKGGLTFKNGSAKDLSLVMKKFIDNKDLLDDFRSKSLEQADFFDYRKIAPKIESELIKIIKK